MGILNITRGTIVPVLTAATGTGAGTQYFVKDSVPRFHGEPGTFVFGLYNVVGTFTTLTINLEFTPVLGAQAYWETVLSWNSLTQPMLVAQCSEAGFYRMNVTAFSGGTQFDVWATIGNSPAGQVSITGNITAVNPAVGLTNATAPTSAIETGMVDAGGKLQAVSAANPIPVAQQGSVAVTGTFWQTTQPVNAGDVIDATNSSTTPLAGGAVFTGTAKATAGFSQLIVAVDTDQPSASTSTTGIFVQWSEDGTNWGDYDGGSFSSSDVGLGQGYSYPIKRAYYRVVYTNGATLQTYFRLQSILKVNTSVGRLIDLIDTIDPNTHAQVVRSRQFGASAYGGGTFNDSVIKNPSTAAAATDPALVVSVSPNSPASLAAETTKVIGTVRALGNAGAIFDGATAATAPANAVQSGNRGSTALPTAVADGQLVAPMTDKYGRQVVVNNTVRDLLVPVSVQTTDTSAHNLTASLGTGIYADLISLTITNETATATVVSLSDGTITYKIALAANGGICNPFPSTLPASSTATAWTVTSSATVTLDFIAVFAKNK